MKMRFNKTLINILEDYSPFLIAIGAFILGWFGHVIYSM